MMVLDRKRNSEAMMIVGVFVRGKMFVVNG